MKILHLTFENFQDVPGLLSRSHRFFGDEGVLATMSPSTLGFPNGITLNYPLLNSNLIRKFRKITGRENVNVLEHALSLKIKGANPLQRIFFKSRDLIWLYKLHAKWNRYEFGDFDIFHFDGDIPFIYGDRILKKLKHKRIVTHFFGSELRKWGICHSPTRRTAKGTADIVEAINKLKKKIKLEFLLIEGVSHKKCMELKRTCDIGIDQIGNYAGTGYGRSGLEFLALGIPTITEIPDEYEKLLPGHPFVKVTKRNFEDVLYNLLIDAELRRKKREQGIKWVRDFCSPRRIMGKIYEEYQRLGWK
jgi:hypothetical protein